MFADPPGTSEAIEAGALHANAADVSMHLGCCCSTDQREAIELVVVYGFNVHQSATMLRRRASTIYKQVRAFWGRVRRCEKRRT